MLGYALLSAGCYAEGWRCYLERTKVPSLRNGYPPLPLPRWRGENLSGKSIIVWSEQGAGDMIMFSRFVYNLSDCGASVTLATSPRLARLFSTLPAQILVLDGQVEIPPSDFLTLAGDLPAYLNIGPEDIPRGRYLDVAPASHGGIGVMTRGDHRHPNDANRSLPTCQAERLLSLPGATNLHPEATGARDFWETAQIVSGLDLVVTVDTAVAHLAGALGKPVLILVPARMTDWRWLRDRSDSPWYPSAQLIRQRSSDWSEAVTRAIGTASLISISHK
jgi:hypothetical protein